MRQAGLFGLSDQLKRVSDCGDPLETMSRVVDFEVFRPALEKALAYGDGTKGGRPPYDPVAMFKVLILAAQNTVSDARMEFLIRDRLSWLRFLGFDLGAVTPDENTIRLFREKLTRAGAIDALFIAFDRQLRERGYLPMGGQIVDATLVAAPKQRNTAAEKEAIKAGKSAAEIWPDQPAKAAQKDPDARWTLKFAKARALPDGRPGIDIAIPSFGYKSSIAICRRYGFIRKGKVTDGARFDGRMLRDVVTSDNTRLRRLGRHRLPKPIQRGLAEIDCSGQPRSPQETQGQADVGADRARQCCQVCYPRSHRARVRPAKGSDGAVHPHHRYRPRRDEDRPRQPCLQHRPTDLPRTTRGHGIAAPDRSDLRPGRAKNAHFSTAGRRSSLSLRRVWHRPIR